MGRAEDLFKRISREGASVVDQLILDAQTENLWLDFKRSGNDGKGAKLHEDDWKNFARALSGFANSDGGVILWGVKCSPDPVYGDVPSGIEPIENPRRFVSLLENALSACTVPSVPGVESIAIPRGEDGRGLVATLIPASPLAPHQCVKPVGVLSYYLRAGSNFMPVPHAVLSGMFGRRPQPRVFHTYQGRVDANAGGDFALKFDVSVFACNGGPAIARDAFMNILMGVPSGGSECGVGPDPDGTGNWIVQHAFGVMTSAIAAEHYRLAPQVHARVFRIQLTLVPPFRSAFGMTVSVGCDGAPMHVSEVLYETHEVEEKYDSALGLILDNKKGANEKALKIFFQ